jgi:outer membrane protein assembly factor BamB
MSLVVSGKNGELICLATDDGKELWRINIEGESVSQPLIKNDVVVVKTIDGKLRGFSILDGTELWLIEQQIPSLTLRGSSTPLIIGNNVISGFDNGRLISIRLDNGAIEWESMLSPPSGRTDLERLNDLDGSIASVGQDIYAANYQGRLASIAAESGQ